jgi:DNA repair protein RecN (Recombination protein N)
MLTQLAIENFAIIDRLLVRFDAGFTVITGETGAGKSIIIDALQAALGARVPADTVRSGAKFASVEAIFDVAGTPIYPTLEQICSELGIDLADGLMVRREINAGGRSSARLNGRAVPIGTVAAIGELLVDIHGQSDHLSVLRRDRQLDVLDRFGELLPLRREVADAVRRLTALRSSLDALQSGQRESAQRVDLLRFQVGEIEAAGLRPGEDADLDAQRAILGNAERLVTLSSDAHSSLTGDTTGAIDALNVALHDVRELAAIDATTAELLTRLDSVVIDVEDIAAELRRYSGRIEADPAELQSVEERLDLITRLKRKYGSTIEDVVAFGEQARHDLEDIENFDERVEMLQREMVAAEGSAGDAAGRLSRARCGAARTLAAQMRDALQGLGLKGTGFDVRIDWSDSSTGIPVPGTGRRLAYTSSGVDLASFLVSFNPGEELKALERVASGGETARFLLALKSVLAEADATPTLVFDEVDVGVGGRHGIVVGERLRALARDHQVISITHLPQVAALGDHHLTVNKAIAEGRTSTVIREIEAGDRVLEIAEMMSGTGSESAQRNAQELLDRAAAAH